MQLQVNDHGLHLEFAGIPIKLREMYIKNYRRTDHAAQFNPLAPELYIQIVAHHLCKM